MPLSGSRVRSLSTGKVGTVTRVIDPTGALGGLFEVRWDGQRLSRRAGFQPGRDLTPVMDGLRHRDGLVTFAG